ncbi:MAG TPA: polyketide synthase [Gemmatimonadaceae bacterium]
MELTHPLVATSIDASGIATITLDDPSTSNALGEPMVHALTEAFDAVGRSPDTKVVVLIGVGDTFSSGATLDALLKLVRGDGHPSDITLPRALLGCPVPVIAAVEGHAIGGGFALALAADIVLLSGESRYGFSFMNLGFTPGMGTTRLCEHVLSPAIVHELLYTGEMRRGSQFDRFTGINHVLPRSEVREAAFDVAGRIAEKPRAAIELLKRTLSLSRRAAFESALTMEAMMHQLTMRAPDIAVRIEAEYA